jgi:hypothetical protein
MLNDTYWRLIIRLFVSSSTLSSGRQPASLRQAAIIAPMICGGLRDIIPWAKYLGWGRVASTRATSSFVKRSYFVLVLGIKDVHACTTVYIHDWPMFRSTYASKRTVLRTTTPAPASMVSTLLT